MSGISGFLRNYQFLDLTASVLKTGLAECQKPSQTWGQIGSKWVNICYYNAEAAAAVGLDVVTTLFVSALHGCHLFRPLPPAPLAFPAPHDNVQFVNYAIQRALWNWNPALKKEMEEGIADSLSDKWNVFQVVGEWSLAFSFENAQRSSYFKPTFLTISEPLESGESFRSVGDAFSRLRQKDRAAILDALYRQKEPDSLGASGKKVFQNIRSLASKLHQGNQNFLSAYSEYVKNKASGRMEASVCFANQPRSAAPLPSAPPMPSAYVASSDEQRMLSDVKLQRSALMSAIGAFAPGRKTALIQMVINDRSPVVRGWNSLESFLSCPPEFSSKYFIARLAMLRLFKEGFQQTLLSECPRYFSAGDSLRSGKNFYAAGAEFGALSNRDFDLLQEAIVDPWRSKLDSRLRERLYDLSEFANLLQRKDIFRKTYEALQIDLVAS